jgi:hypothetical protein
LLDITQQNPITRLLKSPDETPEQALNRLRAELKRESERDSIKKLKAKAKKGKKKALAPSFTLVGVNDEERTE